MFQSGRFYFSAAIISGIIILGLASFGSSPVCYGSNTSTVAGVNEAGTIVPFSTGMSTDSPLDNLSPKDGKIEGRLISKLTPAGINNRGQVVGLCVLDAPEKNYAFVREPDGRIWIFKTPSSSGQGEFTDISDSGKAVGFYENEKIRSKTGFLMDAQGKWVMDIQYPANACPDTLAYLHTEPNGINDNDEIVGNYQCTEKPEEADPLFQGNGFYRATDGTFYRVQYENARRTVAGKISNTGIIFGYYVIDGKTWIPFAAGKNEVLKPLIP